jgi:glycosyltransferase involved in cell wall biosynthesis
MKVAHLTSVHGAFDIRIFHKECRSLAKAGHNVTLIAPHVRDEIRDAVHIKAVPVRRSRLSRVVRTVLDVFLAAIRTNAEVYHLHDPELLLCGYVLSVVGRRVVYDAHEDVPKDILGKTYIPKRLRVPLAWICQRTEEFVCSRISAVSAATPSIGARLSRSKRSTVTIQNFPRLDELGSPSRTSWTERGAAVAYIGGVMEDRGIFQMLEAMELLAPECSVRLELAHQSFPSEIYSAACRKPGWALVIDHGCLERQAVIDLLGMVRAGLVLFHPIPNNVSSMPHKLFEYMAAGLPVIASDFPDWRALISRAGCGILIDPLNPNAIAEAISYIFKNPVEAEQMGLAGRRAVEQTYNWASEERKLLQLYSHLSANLRSA